MILNLVLLLALSKFIWTGSQYFGTDTNLVWTLFSLEICRVVDRVTMARINFSTKGHQISPERAPVCDFTVHLCRYMYWIKSNEGVAN